MNDKKSNPLMEILTFAKGEKAKLIVAAVLSAISVVFGIIPYIAAGRLKIHTPIMY